MKTEDLKAQGLTEEQINFVMGENGKDLKTLQDENSSLKTEKAQLENEKNVLEKEKKEKEKAIKDLEEKTISKEDYEKKIQEIEANAKKEHADYIFNELLNKAFIEAKIKNTDNTIKAVKASLDLTKITTDKEGKTLIGINEQLEALKKSDPHFFEAKIGGKDPKDPDPNGNKGDEGNSFSMASNLAKEANKREILKNTILSSFSPNPFVTLDVSIHKKKIILVKSM